jgi:hypothetical protein
MKPKYRVSKKSPKRTKPPIAKNSWDIVVPMNGRSILYHANYQLAPAITKKAPDKNLKMSFQFQL